MRTTLACLALLPCLAASDVFAQARTCGDLWYRRNAEYKAAGYCFKTARAIRTFGNAGCGYDDMAAVPLSYDQRLIVRDIIEQEREMGCRD